MDNMSILGQLWEMTGPLIIATMSCAMAAMICGLAMKLVPNSNGAEGIRRSAPWLIGIVFVVMLIVESKAWGWV
ncbi:hypothetical protein [Paenibacillus marinisediminis]